MRMHERPYCGEAGSDRLEHLWSPWRPLRIDRKEAKERACERCPARQRKYMPEGGWDAPVRALDITW